MKRVLVVCLGNRWRSPVAGLLLQHFRPDLQVRSRGLARREGVRMERLAREFVRHRWPTIDVDAHRSRTLGAGDLQWADLVVVMSARHAARLAEHAEVQVEQVVHLAHYIGAERIDDPHMKTRDAQLAILSQIALAVQQLAAEVPR